MKLLKFGGWSVVGLLLLFGLAYGFFPILASKMITRILTNHGFENVAIVIDYPGPRTLTVHSLSFRTPIDSGSSFIIVRDIELTYSLDSLFNNVVDTVNIRHVNVVWNDRLTESPSFQSPSGTAPQTESRIGLDWLHSDPIVPPFLFRHLHIKQMEISNPLAPPALQHTSITASVDSLKKGYEGTIHLEGKDLPLNLITFSFEKNGIISLRGRHTNVPENQILFLQAFLDTSSTPLRLKGQTNLDLHALINMAAALYPIPSEFHAVTGTLSGTWMGTLLETPPPTGSALVSIQGDFAIDTRLPAWSPIVKDLQVFTQGTFTVNDRGLALLLQPSSSGTVSLSLNSVIPSLIDPFISHEGLRSFSWNIRQPVHIIVPLHNQGLHGAQIPTGQIQIGMRNSSEQLDILLSPQNIHWKTSGVIAGKAAFTTTLNLRPPSTPPLLPKSLFFALEASLLISEDDFVLTLNPSSFFRLSNMHTATLQVPSLKGRFPNGLTWSYHTEQQIWKLQTATSLLVLPSLSFQGRQWKLGKILTKDIVMTHTPETWIIKGESEATYVHTQSESTTLPASAWHTRYSADSSSVTVLFRGQTLGHPLQVGGQVRLDLRTGNGWGTMTLEPLRLDPQTLVLSQLIQPWPFPDMDVTHGTVSASAELSFGKNATTQFHVTRFHGIVDINKLSGFMRPTILEGLTTHVEILGEQNAFRITPTPVHLRQIQSAIDLTDTSFIFSSGTINQASVPKISVINLSTHLLGGRVTLEKAVYDPARPTHEVTLNVQGLNLGDILRLEQQEAVKGTGTLDGVLPLFISNSDVEVRHGSLQARPPGGTLQITISEATARNWTQSQPNLDLILKSLQNFQYSKLKVGVDYEKTGILKLATRLEGKNPDYRKGVPIHFNLNIEENIPALMKSLSLVQGLEDHIEKMMTGTKKFPSKEK